MQLVVLGLNHKSAPINVREQFSFDKSEVSTALDEVYHYDNISECVVLSTCNRTEIYAVLEEVNDPHQYMLTLMKELKHTDSIDEEAFFLLEGEDCIEHLFRVAASLDSLVLGEGQILSQLKTAYLSAATAGFTGAVFNILFQKAIHVGKLIRTQTGIANTPVSVSYTAVNLAEDSLDKPLSEATVLILGAGKMSELTATHLQAKGVKTIFVSNRTFSKAELLARRFNGQAIKLDDFVEQAKLADIIITSTGSPHYIVKAEHARDIIKARHGKPIVMIDIAVPRDIDPVVAQMDGIYLFNIDALESVVEANKHIRQAEAKKAEPMIQLAMDEINEKLNYLSVRPMMVQLSDKGETIRRRELHRALVKLPHATEHDIKMMDSMSRMIVRKLLREPMIRLGEIAGTEEEGLYWELFRDIFNLKVETDHEK